MVDTCTKTVFFHLLSFFPVVVTEAFDRILCFFQCIIFLKLLDPFYSDFGQIIAKCGPFNKRKVYLLLVKPCQSIRILMLHLKFLRTPHLQKRSKWSFLLLSWPNYSFLGVWICQSYVYVTSNQINVAGSQYRAYFKKSLFFSLIKTHFWNN